MNDIAKRAAKTFIQSFLATVAVGATNVTDIASAKALAIAAVAAAISAVWNYILTTK